ncbi:uncharacterized protein CLUP02_18358 [Colletotrichum lupini]|uniref:Major facilitator superfamily transporter n=1 Tax=Colletotrichum lupini TaxID=145971 RepID=A0A9Q8SGU7_9PEZI|nr:uncharacterized protein CLUP02_18358 [Colletotrichum lupini]UQC76843.1 hypothetical protein CLUP02_18358 [Colletotrichum lupini]
MAAFRGGQDVANLGLALFLIDFIIEPLIWGHTSEVFGRSNLVVDTLGLSNTFNLSAVQTSGILAVMISQLRSTFGSSPPEWGGLALLGIAVGIVTVIRLIRLNARHKGIEKGLDTERAGSGSGRPSSTGTWPTPTRSTQPVQSAGSGMIRDLLDVTFPMFTTKMYQDLGIRWTFSVPASLVLACAPFKMMCSRYGPRIRE